MGEVLENGVYLPDEGERNAYNGLKSNWNAVDAVVAQVQALSSAGLIRKAVDELPTEDIETNVIYMLKAIKPNGDTYRIEYMYIDGHWDALGTSETALDDYYTKAETDDLPAVKSGINATRVSNYDAHLANNDVHVTLANKQSWDGKQNALDTNQTAAVNSGVTAAKVTGYDSHVNDTDVHVTTGDKTAWNAKQDGLSQTQLAAVNSGITEAKRTGYDSHLADTDAHVTTADKAAWNGKQNALTQAQLANIAAVPDKANSADLATVATTGDYGDLLNAPTIPTVNNATLTIQKNGTDVATFTANASSNVTANLSIPVNTSDLNNDAGFLTQHNPVDNELSATSENALQNKVVKSELDGKAPLVHTHAAGDITSGTFNIARIPNLDASKITSGTIDIARLPKGALERLVKVANQAARFALTTSDVQLGDTVQQLDTGVMYVVTDETKLDSADGYTEYTAGSATSVPWSGVTGKPADYTPASHSHGNITNDGKVGTAANKPLITGTDGVVQAGSFGNAVNTFCEGNDSRLSDARTPVAHTHLTADVTDLLNSAHTWSGDNTYSKTVAIERSTDTGNFLALKNTVAELGSTPASATPVTIAFRDKGNDNLGYMGVYYDTDGSNHFRLYVRNKYTSGAPSTTGSYDYAFFGLRLNADKSKEGIIKASFRPYDNNTHDLGSSSNQWNNLYAKNYYYNGVAWGLDKYNQWTEVNDFNNLIGLNGAELWFKNIQIEDITANPTSVVGKSIVQIWNKVTTQYTGGIIDTLDTAGTHVFEIVNFGYPLNDVTPYQHRFRFASKRDGTASFYPTYPNVDLGTSTNKWKSLWTNDIDSVPTDTVEWHNSHYRGINLISDGHFANMAALLTAIRNQDWSDIYIGDYVELTFTYEGASRTVKFYVGEIDKFYKVGNTSLETHHLVMVTGDLGINQVMNDTNTTAGGYVGSKAHTVTLPALYAILNPLFNNAILTHKEHLSNTVLSAQTVSLSLDDGNGAVSYTCSNFPVYSSGDPNTPGCVTAGAWYDCNLVLMSEIEMFGSNRFASSGIDDVMCPEGQIAAFKYNRNLQTLNRTINTWLRNVNSASRFCRCNVTGYSDRNVASYTYVRLRPRFLIG